MIMANRVMANGGSSGGPSAGTLGCALALVFGAAAALGCSGSESSGVGRVGRIGQALVTPGPGEVTLSVPALMVLESGAVVASENANMGDRFTVQGEGDGAIVAMGGSGAFIGNDSDVVDVFGRTGIELRDRVEVAGSLFSTGSIIVPQTSTVQGVVVTDYQFDPPEQFTWTYDAPVASQGPVALEPNQTASKDPGRYGNWSIKSGASLHISSGEYHIDSLDALEPDGKLIVDASDGPVFLYIHGVMRHRGSMVSINPGEEPNIIVVVLGQDDVFLETPFHGFLVAPNALVQMRSTATPHVTSVFAKRIASDGGAVLVHRPFDRDILFPDLLPLGEEEPWDGNLPIMGTGAGQTVVVETCDPGLRLVTDLDGLEVSSQLAYNNPDLGACPYQECLANPFDGTEVPLGSPPPEELNEPPGVEDQCVGQPTRYPCGVIEETIEWDDDFGPCTTDADCVLFGKVCAQICVEEGCTGGPECLVPTCTTPQKRCAQVEPGCDPMPTEAPCSAVRECAHQGYTGNPDPADPEAGSDLEEVRSPTAIAETPVRIELRDYEIDAVCEPADPLLHVLIQPENNDRDVNSGNDTWGIQVRPTMTHRANVQPQRLGGEATVDVGAAAGLVVTAMIWDNPVEVFNAEGRAEFTTCGVTMDRTLRLFESLHFDPGPGDSLLIGPDDECNNQLGLQGLDFEALKKAQYNALEAKKYADHCLGGSGNEQFWEDLCTSTNDALIELGAAGVGFTDTLNCNLQEEWERAPSLWLDYYVHYRERIAERLANIDQKSAAARDAAESATLPFLEQRHNFMADPVAVIIPIGPVPVTIEIELGGSWGIEGELIGELEDNPSAKIRAKAELEPSVGVVAVAFAGVGLGPVRVGIAGELLLADVGTPIHTELLLEQQPHVDPRTAPAGIPDGLYAFASSLPEVPSFRPFGPEYYDWQATWTYGAGARTTFLSGNIDLQARVNLLFYKKTFSKKLAHWNGFNHDYVFFGSSLSLGPDGKPAINPLSGHPDYGAAFEQVPFVDPAHIQTLDLWPTSCDEPPDLGRCQPNM